MNRKENLWSNQDEFLKWVFLENNLSVFITHLMCPRILFCFIAQWEQWLKKCSHLIKCFTLCNLGQWGLTHGWQAKTQTILRFRAIRLEPLLCAGISYLQEQNENHGSTASLLQFLQVGLSQRCLSPFGVSWLTWYPQGIKKKMYSQKREITIIIYMMIYWHMKLRSACASRQGSFMC